MTTDKHNGYSLADDLGPIMKGTVPLPNASRLEGDIAVAMLGHYGKIHHGAAKAPDGGTRWNARYFLDQGQDGRFYGSGIAAWTESKVDIDGYKTRAVAFKFAICDHDQVEGAGANHMRGWHPAYCKRCGLDMSINSGD